ncbi:MAG: YraN family protein [Gammaproteobacteria bacterium]|nr:YraN family protein [Rhodocyclaceae bacterium]MBU3910544.1 YraN family protein [Gammaproteobacteria bacterium]MBU3990395.1 YraN family protein [Gammaproteobacteria bacterium]MBU4005025.1 YraN family protein [Gammaproteobacteria bacterium]MBU4020618.1 YraN family protein [Gammaproteobacteria bacterium]
MSAEMNPATNTSQSLGAVAEAAAAQYLAARGLTVIARNFRVKGGEIDLICRDAATTVFVEVRRRASADFGGAAASITLTKQRRLILAARHWLVQHGDCACRFDCVLFDGDRLEWMKDAFRLD